MDLVNQEISNDIFILVFLLGMFFGYIFVLTFFFAIHCLDAKREEENLACLFCVPKNKRVREMAKVPNK